MGSQSNNRLVGVFDVHQDPSTDKPMYRIKFKRASEMVRKGSAVIHDERSVRLITRDVVSSSSRVYGSHKQGVAYESLASDPNPRMLVGGLNRTETKPAAFQVAKGARVGHQ
jgi:hypothetical protein